jgi:hypothetical protein
MLKYIYGEDMVNKIKSALNKIHENPEKLKQIRLEAYQELRKIQIAESVLQENEVVQ